MDVQIRFKNETHDFQLPKDATLGLLMNEIKPEAASKIRFYTNITEFAKYVTNSKVFASKLVECGNLIMKDNALEIGFEHFVK